MRHGASPRAQLTQRLAGEGRLPGAVAMTFIEPYPALLRSLLTPLGLQHYEQMHSSPVDETSQNAGADRP